MAVNTLVASHATIDEYGCVHAGLSAHRQLTVRRAVFTVLPNVRVWPLLRLYNANYKCVLVCASCKR